MSARIIKKVICLLTGDKNEETIFLSPFCPETNLLANKLVAVAVALQELWWLDW